MSEIITVYQLFYVIYFENEMYIEQFFECEPKIIKQLARKVKDEGARDDLLHEVFIKFAVKFDNLKNQDNLCGYLHRITDTTIIDYFRRENRFLLTDDEKTFEKVVIDSAEDSDFKLADCCLKSFINQLSPKYKEALILTELENKPQKETAKQLGLSYSGLKSRVQRAREMLKKSILDCCDYKFDRYGNIVGCCGS